MGLLKTENSNPLMILCVILFSVLSFKFHRYRVLVSRIQELFVNAAFSERGLLCDISAASNAYANRQRIF